MRKRLQASLGPRPPEGDGCLVLVAFLARISVEAVSRRKSRNSRSPKPLKGPSGTSSFAFAHQGSSGASVVSSGTSSCVRSWPHIHRQHFRKQAEAGSDRLTICLPACLPHRTLVLHRIGTAAAAAAASTANPTDCGCCYCDDYCYY